MLYFIVYISVVIILAFLNVIFYALGKIEEEYFLGLFGAIIIFPLVLFIFIPAAPFFLVYYLTKYLIKNRKTYEELDREYQEYKKWQK